MSLGFPERERRQAPRVPFVSEALVHAAGRQLPCTTVDLSAAGLLLVPPASARPGLEMVIVVALPRTDHALSIEGILVREGSVRGMYAWGVRFVRLSQAAHELLSHYVQRRLEDMRPVQHHPTDGGNVRARSSGATVAARGDDSDLPPRTDASAPTISNTPARIGEPVNAPVAEGAHSSGATAPDARDTSPLRRRSSGAYRRVFGHSEQGPAPETASSAKRASSTPSVKRASSTPSAKQTASTADAGASSSGTGSAPARPTDLTRESSDPGSQAHRVAYKPTQPTAPVLKGLSSPLGVNNKTKPTDLHEVQRPTDTAKMRPTLPHKAGPRRGGAAAGQARPRNAARLTRREREWESSSHCTPLEIRQLYSEALEDVGGTRKKKKKK